MKTPFSKLVIFYLAILFSFSSCIENEEPKPEIETDPYSVTGKAVDALGNPLTGVKVRAENTTGNNIHINGTTGADGKYNLKLSSVGGWKIYAWKEVEYKGKIYHLRLGMPEDKDYDDFSPKEHGTTKNFVWKLSGRIPDRGADVKNGFGYFGGSLLFVNINSLVPNMIAGTKVTVTLTPTNGAKYLDGTIATAAGKIQKTFTITSGVDQNYYIGDVPVTEYHISIESELNGTKKQVYVGSNTSKLYEWLEFDFNPALGSSGSYESGIQGPNDTPFYLGQKN